MSSKAPNFDKLSSANYPTWAGEMQAWLMASGLWRIVNGSKPRPAASSPPTEAQAITIEDWETKAEKAAGYLYLMVEQDQRVHFVLQSEVQGTRESPNSCRQLRKTGDTHKKLWTTVND